MTCRMVRRRPSSALLLLIAGLWMGVPWVAAPVAAQDDAPPPIFTDTTESTPVVPDPPPASGSSEETAASPGAAVETVQVVDPTQLRPTGGYVAPRPAHHMAPAARVEGRPASVEGAQAPATPPSEPRWQRRWLPILQLGYTIGTVEDDRERDLSVRAFHISIALPVLLSDPGNRFQHAVAFGLSYEHGGQTRQEWSGLDFHASALLGYAFRFGYEFALTGGAYWSPGAYVARDEVAGSISSVRLRLGVAWRFLTAGVDVSSNVASFGVGGHRVTIGPRFGLTF